MFHFSTNELIVPLTGYDNVPNEHDKKKPSTIFNEKSIKNATQLENDQYVSVKRSNRSAVQNNSYVNVERKRISSSRKTQLPDDDAPILMPKQHVPIQKSILMKHTNEFEHYQLPLNNQTNEDDDYQPPLPPKQRHQNHTSRAMVYDFIGSELQELRVALAQFNGNSSSKFINK